MARHRVARFVSPTAVFVLRSALAAPFLFAAAKDTEKPGREMLRMIEFLKEMEILQQIDTMRDMHEADHAGPPPAEAGLNKIPRPKNKGTQK